MDISLRPRRRRLMALIVIAAAALVTPSAAATAQPAHQRPVKVAVTGQLRHRHSCVERRARLVVPGDAKGGRYVSTVTQIYIGDVDRLVHH